ncbi:hypothetical protein SARC_11561 [Sphaeroforma arctica JP610]|uniref:Uncharacterized protein n=1 Tax=Sphaeroforma arctica JP610 TaxID=667725 RepID=A0A0L0FGM9_9EUKA|nr:hypothetical protein SARC_11561 [Sphaeroforma arctica JP610]KNC75925.1 hypothetical protein SARC_11561 [Sphaeroforma arctica JP610]|eukprot:XP_014149827.1 hypothetical protein SARC_11561 [Sphaeroforma arctica JP610]
MHPQEKLGHRACACDSHLYTTAPECSANTCQPTCQKHALKECLRTSKQIKGSDIATRTKALNQVQLAPAGYEMDRRCDGTETCVHPYSNGPDSSTGTATHSTHALRSKYLHARVQ